MPTFLGPPTSKGRPHFRISFVGVPSMQSSPCHRLASVAIACFLASFASCGLSKSTNTGSGKGPAPGGYAAGIGGAGQTGEAHDLVGIQVPGGIPFPTAINANGSLTGAQVTMSKNHSESNPFAMTAAIDPSGSFLYQAVWPGIWTFTIDRQTGNLTEMSTSPYLDTVNISAVAVDQLGKFLFAYGASQVYVFTIQSGTGQLSPVTGSPFPSFDSGQQYAIASSRLAVSQNDKYLYVATSMGIAGYSIDAGTGALTAINGSPFGASAGSASAVVAPASGFLYETVTGSTAAISGYSIDSSTGALTAIAGSPFGPTCNTANLTSPASGKFLFGAGCGNYQINSTNGVLTHVADDPTAPETTWAVFDPTGTYVWILYSQAPCFHCQIGVSPFQVDATSGAVTMVPNEFFLMTNSEVGGGQSLAISQ